MDKFVWLPPGARRRSQLAPPSGDVTLADGRRLRLTEAFNASEYSHGGYWQGPGGLTVLCTLDETPPEKGFGALLHVSLSYPSRDPDWGTIVAVKEAFFGRHVDAMMVLRDRDDWVNVHKHCFHIWQTPERWGLR